MPENTMERESDGGAIPGHWVADLDTPDAGSHELKAWRRDLLAVISVMFADESGPPDLERLRWTCEQVHEFVRRVGGKSALAFRLSLSATTWLAPFWAGHLPPFRRNSFERQRRIMEVWEESPMGLSLFALKAFASMHYFEHPATAQECGFDGRPTGDHHEG